MVVLDAPPGRPDGEAQAEGLRVIDLSQQMRSILANMELLAHGTITNYSPTGGGGSADTKPPTGESRPPHEHWARRWEKAVYDDLEEEHRESAPITRHRRRVIEKAQADLDSYRKRAEGQVVGETESELEARIIKDGEGEPVDRVALAMRCTPTLVRKARLKAGRSVVTGKAPRDTVIDAPTDQHDRARALAEDGHTERQIAWLTGLPKTTLRRILGRAA
jgi:hypothetical protein